MNEDTKVLRSLSPADIERMAMSVFTIGPEPISSDVESLEKRAETAAAIVVMMRGLGWKALTERVARQVEYLNGRLMTGEINNDLNHIRGQLVGVQILKTIAQEVITEGRNALIELKNAPPPDPDEHL